jgi:hypothetical protein
MDPFRRATTLQAEVAESVHARSDDNRDNLSVLSHSPFLIRLNLRAASHVGTKTMIPVLPTPVVEGKAGPCCSSEEQGTRVGRVDEGWDTTWKRRPCHMP